MNNILLNYLAEAAFCLLLCTLLYKVTLKATTLHKTKRLLLLLGIVGSLALPLLPNSIELIIEQKVYTSMALLPSSDVSISANDCDTVNVASSPTHRMMNESISESVALLNWEQILLIIYGLGAFGFLCLFFVRLFSSIFLLSRTTKGKLQHTPVYFSDTVAEPCNIFSFTLLPSAWSAHPQQISSSILQHEAVHAKQLHWVDTLLAEILTVILWFFPLAYLFKNWVKINLEFLADASVLENTDKKIYQLQLLKNLTEKPFAFANTFYSSPIKIRIKMMEKQPTPKWRKIALIALVPIFVVPSLALVPLEFSKPEAKKTEEVYLQPAVVKVLPPLFESDIEYPDYWPIEKEQIFKMTSGFGKRMNPFTKKLQHHVGVDFSAQIGTPVYAAASGKVLEAVTIPKGDKRHKIGMGRYGNRIDINHEKTGYMTRYAQLEKVVVKEGQYVRKGQLIGYVGSSGLSTGAHLHFEIREGKKAVDPMRFLQNLSQNGKGEDDC